jgi:hypothetical protein
MTTSIALFSLTDAGIKAAKTRRAGSDRGLSFTIGHGGVPQRESVTLHITSLS